jgi:hypothetical protein
MGLSSACTAPVPPTVTRQPIADLKENPSVYLQAVNHQALIMQSLRSAGVDARDVMRGTDYTLDVRVGRNRGTTSCGDVSNIAYILRGDRRSVMVIKGRGKTGSCPENIFDAMSQKLASYLGP